MLQALHVLDLTTPPSLHKSHAAQHFKTQSAPMHFGLENGQNSLDARLDPSKTVTLDISFLTLQKNVLQNMTQKNHWSHHACTPGQTGRAMVVQEGNTTGLEGFCTLDWDAISKHMNNWEKAPPFLAFFAGEGITNKTKGNGGGHFGIGKTVLYNASKSGTVLVYSKTSKGTFLLGRVENPSRQVDGKIYAANSWLVKPGATAIEPLCDEEADAVIRALGVPLRTTRGTTFIVLDPHDVFEAPFETNDLVESFLPLCLHRDFEVTLMGRNVREGLVRFPLLAAMEEPCLTLEPLILPSKPEQVANTIRAWVTRNKDKISGRCQVKVGVEGHNNMNMILDIAHVPDCDTAGWMALRRSAVITKSPLRMGRKGWAVCLDVSDSGLSEVLAQAENPAHDRWRKSDIEEAKPHGKTVWMVLEAATRIIDEIQSLQNQGKEKPLHFLNALFPVTTDEPCFEDEIGPEIGSDLGLSGGTGSKREIFHRIEWVEAHEGGYHLDFHMELKTPGEWLFPLETPHEDRVDTGMTANLVNGDGHVWLKPHTSGRADLLIVRATQPNAKLHVRVSGITARRPIAKNTFQKLEQATAPTACLEGAPV